MAALIRRASLMPYFRWFSVHEGPSTFSGEGPPICRGCFFSECLDALSAVDYWLLSAIFRLHGEMASWRCYHYFAFGFRGLLLFDCLKRYDFRSLYFGPHRASSPDCARAEHGKRAARLPDQVTMACLLLKPASNEAVDIAAATMLSSPTRHRRPHTGDADADTFASHVGRHDEYRRKL